MIVFTEKEIYSTEGLYINRIGTDVYFKRANRLPSDLEGMFREVSSIPVSELDAAKENKINEITAYDESSSVNEFFVNGISMWYKADKRATIRNLIESTIKTGGDKTTLWTEEEPIIPLEVDCESALMMLAQLEVYAGNCLAITQSHKANVEALTTKEEVEAYDYTVGYPEKPRFEL